MFSFSFNSKTAGVVPCAVVGPPTPAAEKGQVIEATSKQVEMAHTAMRPK